MPSQVSLNVATAVALEAQKQGLAGRPLGEPLIRMRHMAGTNTPYYIHLPHGLLHTPAPRVQSLGP